MISPRRPGNAHWLYSTPRRRVLPIEVRLYRTPSGSVVVACCMRSGNSLRRVRCCRRRLVDVTYASSIARVGWPSPPCASATRPRPANSRRNWLPTRHMRCAVPPRWPARVSLKRSETRAAAPATSLRNGMRSMCAPCSLSGNCVAHSRIRGCWRGCAGDDPRQAARPRGARAGIPVSRLTTVAIYTGPHCDEQVILPCPVLFATLHDQRRSQ